MALLRIFPFRPNLTAADRALSKYPENGPLWPR